MKITGMWLTVVLWLGAALAAGAEGNLLPNGSFEEGDKAPGGWELAAGGGEWDSAGRTGRRCVQVTGGGEDSSHWRCSGAKLQPGRTYRLSFYARSEGSGGCAIAGPSGVNRDFQPPAAWTRYGFVFGVPINAKEDEIRLGQWHVKGRVWYDDVSLREVTPVHATGGAVILGAGERVRGKDYAFDAMLYGEGSNYARCLDGATARFNSDRWVFDSGSEVVYRHRLGWTNRLLTQRKASVRVSVGYYIRGACEVDCRSGDTGNSAWRRLGTLSKVETKQFALPADLFPADDIFVRLRASTPGSFQVNGYSFQAELERSQPPFSGATQYFDVREQNPELEVDLIGLDDSGPPAVDPGLRLAVTNLSPSQLPLVVELAALPGGGNSPAVAPVSREVERDSLRPNDRHVLWLPYRFRGSGPHTLQLSVLARGKLAYLADTQVDVPSLYDASYGYWLDRNAAAEWWWCEGTYKVARERPAPETKTRRPVKVFAARGEYEPVQIVLRPNSELKNVKVSIAADDARWREAVEVCAVAYHYVQRPTDVEGCVGWWPDALPPVKGPLTLEAGRNQPFWILVKVPRDCPAGEHQFMVNFEGEGLPATTVPVTVQVYDFALPETPSVESGFGLSAGEIKRYHNLATREEERQVWNLYMRSFREHRMAPYDFAPFDPIGAVRSNGVEFRGAAWEGGEVVAENPAAGERCLKLVDDDPRGNVSCRTLRNIPVEPGAKYTVSWRVRTEKAGQPYLVTLTTHDRDGRWISGHNIDLPRRGAGAWERASETVSIAERSPKAAFMQLHLRPTEWQDSGAPVGTAWFDDVALAKVGGEVNLIEDAGFEVVAPRLRPELDFAAWDRQAKRYLDDYGFSRFRLSVKGLAWGTFHERGAGQIGPYKQGSAGYRQALRDYCQALESHLAERGWLDKAYLYWFDEPDPKDYEFVKAGMEEIKRAGPRLCRMLTEEPGDELAGAVDLWCPVLHCFDPAAAHARQEKGEKIWWYVCTGPKAPYPGLFIDRGAIDLRLWLWMTWKWKVQGILVWQTNYWTSSAAFPPPKRQNPWEDPMGYIGGYSHEPGFVGYWGNGDGRFLYPPNRDGVGDRRKYLEGPVSSIRWEMLREGLEDYEYFAILQKEIAKARAAGVKDAVLDDAEKLLEIPEAIVRDLTHFSRDPAALHAHRLRLAEAIERLAGARRLRR